MNILGLSFDFHDSTAALVCDGKLVQVSSEERWSQQKHDSHFPIMAIQHCLKSENLNISDIDKVVVYEDPFLKFTRIVSSHFWKFPFTLKEFNESMKLWLTKKLWVYNRLSKELGIPPEKVELYKHHHSHAAQAFVGSGFKDSAVITLDAVGEWTTMGLWKVFWGEDQKLHFDLLQEKKFPHSLGLLYSTFTGHLGFLPNDQECSTMALSAFGEPSYVNSIKNQLMETESGEVLPNLKTESLSIFDSLNQKTKKDFTEHFGEPRSIQESLQFSSFGSSKSSEQKRYADLATSVQTIFEEEVLKMTDWLFEKTGSRNLCLSGGGALNCVANRRIVEESQFENLFIPPDPGDGGAAIGAAYAYYYENNPCDSPTSLKYGPYLGRSLDQTPIRAIVKEANNNKNVKRWKRFMQMGIQRPYDESWDFQEFSDDEELTTHVANRLMEGEIVGWVQGASEIGPRALGHRSLLFRPDDITLAQKVSERVKKRAAYRPYALSMTEDEADRLFPNRKMRDSSVWKWMQVTAPVQDSLQEKLRGGLHIDGTTRPQVCEPNDDQRFHRLLKKFGAQFGHECLINTSFNEAGFPIANSAFESLGFFCRTEMDSLVIGNMLITKNGEKNESLSLQH